VLLISAVAVSNLLKPSEGILGGPLHLHLHAYACDAARIVQLIKWPQSPARLRDERVKVSAQIYFMEQCTDTRTALASC